MRKLSQIKGEDAVDVMAALLSPASTITSDEKVKDMMRREKTTMAEVAAYVAKKHRDAIIDILHIIDGTTRKEYLAKTTALSLLQDIMYVFDEPELQSLFTGQSQNEADDNSGSVTENTEEEA